MLGVDPGALLHADVDDGGSGDGGIDGVCGRHAEGIETCGGGLVGRRGVEDGVISAAADGAYGESDEEAKGCG